MAKARTADEKVEALYGELRTQFARAAKAHPKAAKQFNQIVDAIDGLAEKSGSFTDRKSEKRLEALSVNMYIGYMAVLAENAGPEIKAEFDAARPKLLEVQKLTGMTKSPEAPMLTTSTGHARTYGSYSRALAKL